jgi:hypothetical protein
VSRFELHELHELYGLQPHALAIREDIPKYGLQWQATKSAKGSLQRGPCSQVV